MKQNKYEKVFEDFLSLIEFGLVKVKGTKYWRLKDFQGANLGGIESEVFKDTNDIIERLDIYINDYILRALDEEIDKEDMSNSFEDLYFDEIIKWYTPEMKEKYPDNYCDIEYLNALIHSDEIDLNNITHKKEDLDLPQNVSYRKYWVEVEDDDDIKEVLSNMLTDEFGFCHNGFDLEEDENNYIITNIDWDLEE